MLSNSKHPSDSTLDSVKLVNQLVLRARLHHHHEPSQSLTSSQGLQLVMCIKLSIPYSIIPLPGSPDLSLPLFPDRNLRLDRSTVFPLSRRSSRSKPIILTSNLLAPEAYLAASALNLSKSFRVPNDKLPKPPSVSVVVRNFAISLVVSPSFLPCLNPPIGLDPRSPVAEYAIVLDCLSDWSTMGPNWPFSVILPTPPCLKNSFRMLLPVEDTPSSSFHLNTFPPLRRERSRFSTLPNNILGGYGTAQSSVFSDDDLRPLSDESEPEGIGSLPDEEDESNHAPCINWSQDERAPRIEGVFQSTEELCIVFGSDPQVDSSALTNPITAKRASSRLSVSVRRTPSESSVESHSAIDLNFHIDLEQIRTQSTSSRTPLVLAIPQQVASQIMSARWFPLNTEGVVQTSFPPPLPGKEVTSSSSLITLDELSPSGSPSSIELTFMPHLDSTIPELELLHTAAPFSELEPEIRTGVMTDEKVLHLPFDQAAEPEKLESVIPYQFIVWFDTEWLIRFAATSCNRVNSRIALNLHGQLDLAFSPSTIGDGSHKIFPIPFFILPSVDEQLCACQISTASNDSSSHQELLLDLPSWASSVETSPDRLVYKLQFHLNNSIHTQTMDSVIMAHFHKPEPIRGAGMITPEKKAAQQPAVLRPSLAESSVSIGTLVISPAGRIRHRSRRSSISNLSWPRKRHRHSVSIKNPSSKIVASLADKQTSSSEPPPRTTTSIRSIQLDLLIVPSELIVTQYGELAITLCRPIDMMVDPCTNVAFRPKTDEKVEILGVWIGDRELIEHEGFTYDECIQSDLELGEVCRLITIGFNVSNNCLSGKLETNQYHLPILRVIFKSQFPRYKLETETFGSSQNNNEKKQSESISCLMPWFHSSVGTYKVSLRTCSTFQLVIDQSTMLTLENPPNVTDLVRYSLPSRTINQTSVSLKPISFLSRDGTSKTSSSVESSNIEPVDGEARENKKHPKDCETKAEDGAVRLSWPEYCTLKLGLNFKTLLICWLIYLVSFMSIQLDEMGARLDLIDQRRSQPFSTQSCHIQPPYPVAGPGLELQKDDSKGQSFGNTVKPFLSQMMANAFKPSSLTYREFLETDNEDQVVISDLPIEEESATKKKVKKLPDSMDDDEFEKPLSDLKTSEFQPNSPPPIYSNHSPQSTGELNEDSYLLDFFHRLLSRSFFQPLSKILQKIPLF